MKTAKRSAPPSRKRGSSGMTGRGREIATSIREVTRQLRGEPVSGIQEYPIEIPEAADIAGIRGSLALSQAAIVKNSGWT
jgi:hypothetical protein